MARPSSCSIPSAIVPAHFTAVKPEARPMSQPAQGHAGPPDPLPRPRTNWPCPLAFWNHLARDRRCETCKHWEIPKEREEERLQTRSKQLPLVSPAPVCPAAPSERWAWGRTGRVPEAGLVERAVSSQLVTIDNLHCSPGRQASRVETTQAPETELGSDPSSSLDSLRSISEPTWHRGKGRWTQRGQRQVALPLRA